MPFSSRPTRWSATPATWRHRPQGSGLQLADLGFSATNLGTLPLPPGMQGAQQLWSNFVPRLKGYKDAAIFPARKGMSYLSVRPLWHGVHSPLAALAAAQAAQGCEGAQTWLLRAGPWRDFYFVILWHLVRTRRWSRSPSGRIRPRAVGRGPGTVAGLVRGPHRLPPGRRGPAPVAADRLHRTTACAWWWPAF